MRERISLSLILALLLGLLCGCRADTPEITQITLIHGWGSTEADHEAMRQIYQDFEKDNPDIRINLVSMPTSDEVIRKAEDMVMVGTIPDVIFLGSTGRDSIYEYMVANDYALDLMPYIKADPQFGSNLAPENLEYWTTADGQLYTVSDVLILAGGYWYNREIFHEAGIDTLPATWEEFISVCARINAWARAEGNDVRAIQMSSEGYLYAIDHMLACGTPQGIQEPVAEDRQALLRAISTLERIYSHSTGENRDYSYRDETSLFNDGQLAIYVNGVWGSAMIGDSLQASYALLPAGTQSLCCESTGTGFVLGNTGDAARQEASVRFLKYMLSTQVQERILLETQQVPANPNIRIEDYAQQMPRFCQAVATVQQAQRKIGVPDMLWSNEKMTVFSEYIFEVLSGRMEPDTFADMLQ